MFKLLKQEHEKIIFYDRIETLMICSYANEITTCIFLNLFSQNLDKNYKIGLFFSSLVNRIIIFI